MKTLLEAEPTSNIQSIQMPIEERFSLVKRLHEWRLKNNLSLRKTAKLINVPQTTLSYWTRRVKYPNENGIYKVKQFLLKQKELIETDGNIVK